MTTVPDQELVLRTLLEHSSGLILVIDADDLVTYASPAVIAQLPSPSVRVIGTSGRHLVHPDSRDDLGVALEECRSTGVPQLVDVCLLLGSRREESAYEANRWFEVTFTNLLHDPQVRGVVLNARDITARMAHQKELEHLAFHDLLTGLPNRLRLERELAREVGPGRLRAVLVLDLDGFTRVNERLGSEVGDAVLRSSAFRLRRGVGAVGLTAYLGGDEFAVVLDTRSADEALHLAESLCGALAEPIRADEGLITVGASLGVAVDELGTLHGDELLRRANIAMHEAKHRSPGSVSVFDAGGAARAAHRAAVASRLVSAEQRGELVLHYQPLLSLRDDVVRGAEALLRWNVEGRLVPPDEFISIAEETGLVVGLGRWAFQRVCDDLEQLPEGAGVRLAVNVSARQLHHQGFVATIESALRRCMLDPAAVTVELTESAVVEDPETAQEVLARVKALGVQIALDDFGTGYSSLSYLLRLPVDILKIDRSFAADLASDERTRLLVRGITALAHDLGMSVTVEGIETAAQLQAVREIGADIAQGFLIGRPVPLEQLRERWCTGPA